MVCDTGSSITAPQGEQISHPYHGCRLSGEAERKIKNMEAKLPLAESLPSEESDFIIRPMPLLHEILFLMTVVSVQILAQAGLAQGIVLGNQIGISFHDKSIASIKWYPAAYSLTAGTFILIAGRLGDVYGHKTLLIIGFIWYSIFSIVAGISIYSHQGIFFDVCRALQGVGPAMLLPAALAILGSVYKPGKKKNIAFALFGSVAPAGFLLGAVFSGLIAELSWWPWAFWVLGIVCALLAVASYLLVPALDSSSQAEVVSQLTSHHSFDYLGSVTGVSGLLLINIAWNQAPSVGWQTPYVIVMLVLGLILVCLFFYHERTTRSPIVPVSQISLGSVLVLGCIAFGWASFGINIYYLWEFLTLMRHSSALEACAQITPSTIAGLFAAMLTGVLLNRHVRPSYILVIALTAFCVSGILVATMPVEQSYWLQSFFAVVIAPFGMDMSFPTATVILSNLVARKHQGIAASLVATVVQYSISIGLGIAGTVESQIRSDDMLLGYRGAWYTAVALSGCGILLAMGCVIADRQTQWSDGDIRQIESG